MVRIEELPTPLSWASRLGPWAFPAFLVLGLLLGVIARGWMRVIAVYPKFTMQGTVGIVVSFAIFAVLQSIAAYAASRPWPPWPRRGARLLGAVGLLPLFVAQGAVMAPAVVLCGLAVWHPSWPQVIRWALGVVGLVNVVAVSSTITTDFGLSVRSLIGVLGLALIYACIVWMAAGTFSRPTATSPAPRISLQPRP